MASPPSVGTIMVARHAFVARSEDELSFSRQDRIQILETDENFNDSWFLGKHLATGQVGLFPQTYMENNPEAALKKSVLSSDEKQSPEALVSSKSSRGLSSDLSSPVDPSFRSSRTLDSNQKPHSRYRKNHTAHDTEPAHSRMADDGYLPYPTESADENGSGPNVGMPHAPSTVQYSPSFSSPLDSTRHTSGIPSPVDLTLKSKQSNLESNGPASNFASSHTPNSLASPVEPLSPLRPISHATNNTSTAKSRISGAVGASIPPRLSLNNGHPSSFKHSSLSLNHPPSRTNRNTDTSSAVHRTIRDIDHHLTSFRAPPGSTDRRGIQTRPTSGSSSDYGSEASHSITPYIHGSETDDEEAEAEAGDELTAIPFSDGPVVLTREVVTNWTPDQVATHLRYLQVPNDACEVFRQQEISGDVLLTLDRETLLHPTLFDLGVVGTRLKVWNKIKEFREELDSNAASGNSRFGSSSLEPNRSVDDSYLRLSHDASSLDFVQPQRPLSGSFAFPAASKPRRHSRLSNSSSTNNFHIVPSSMPVTPGPGHSRETSYSTVYNRHSSFGSPSTNNLASSLNSGHRRKSSAYASLSYRQGPTDTSNSSHLRSYSRVRAITNPQALRSSEGSAHADALNLASPSTKADTVDSSVYDDQTQDTQPSVAGYSETSSARFTGDNASDVSFPEGGSMSAPGSKSRGTLSQMTNPTPIVTNLEENASPSSKAQSPRASESSGGWHLRIPGFRAFSDSTAEKKSIMGLRKPHASSLLKEEVPIPPEVASDPSGPGKGPLSNLSASTLGNKPTSMLSRRQNKKETSAFVHGLVEKTPAEQIEGADFHGWMMKRSTKLIGNWKSRLFILRGRRLSYYYSESDTCEKGLIDISNHQVLPATNERLMGFHATLSQIPSSHTRNVSGSGAEQSTESPTDSKGSDGLFVFKLVPPRSGLTKTVNFTKPTVHYFAVSNVVMGRSWMAALMKANIELVESSIYSTFNLRTIPLKQAQALNFRPPMLDNSQEDVSAPEQDRLVKQQSRELGRAGSGPVVGEKTRLSAGDIDDVAGRSGSAASSKVDSAASGMLGSIHRRDKLGAIDGEEPLPPISASVQ